ncbi:uncharacterized protein LOC113759986 [Coffea eugenioides]|uniref:uncharacterized protein LOC113759986 n=1 Tax=Coffea eugenioides TaxID=49369 RepID=UPI000F61153E|nr:uncharacterized protein LOC113759986 [Coffea eugenioides]
MSMHPESSDRPITTSSTNLANLGAQLSEVLNRFNELSVEMTAQRRVIDQLVAGSSSGVQPESLSASQPKLQPIILPYTQTSVTLHVINPPEEAFTYPTHGPPPTYAPNIQTNPSYTQVPQNYPPVSMNMPLEPQGPYYYFTAEPFTLDTAAQGKVEAGKSSAPIDKNLLKRLDRFDEFMRKSQGLSKQGGLDYNELCLFPDMQLPVGFKAPKFSKYDGTGNSKTHLRMFANKLGKPIDDENLPVRLFPESLEGDALDWYSNLKPEDMRTWLDLSTAFVRQYEYNCELAPTRTTLEGTKRKPSEDHKTYAKRWRKLAAKVEPPMTEEEIVHTFIKARDLPYFEEIFRMTGSFFAEILKAAGKIGTIPPKVYTKGVPPGYDPQSFCAYHSRAPGHSTANCWVLKHKIQDMIEAGDIILRRREEQGPSVSKNPLPAHKDTVGAITTDEEFEQPAKYTVGENEDIEIVQNPFCYRKRMARAYNKKVKPRLFIEGDKVLKRILPVQEEAKARMENGNGGANGHAESLRPIRYRVLGGGSSVRYSPSSRFSCCPCRETHVYPNDLVLSIDDERRQLLISNKAVFEQVEELRAIVEAQVL